MSLSRPKLACTDTQVACCTQVAGSEASGDPAERSGIEGLLDDGPAAPKLPDSPAPLAALLSALHERCLSTPEGKLAVLGGCLLLAVASCSLMGRMSVGLDQAVALPRDSYLQDYYRCATPCLVPFFSCSYTIRYRLCEDICIAHVRVWPGRPACAHGHWGTHVRRDVLRYARVGPPVMYVVQDLELDSRAAVDAVCGSAGCDDDSLVSRVAAAARHPSATFVASPAASWIDDFAAWVSPELSSCCRVYTHGARRVRASVCAVSSSPRLLA